METNIQSKNPCKNGFMPMAFKFLMERLVPIKNKLICSPFLPATLIVEKPSNSGNFEFRNMAKRKKIIKNGKENFFSPSLYK